MKRLGVLSLSFLLTAFCLLPSAPSEAAHVEDRGGLTVVFLEGTPYEIGRQHGELLRDEVRHTVKRVLGYFRGFVQLPGLGALAADWWLDRPWKKSAPWIPSAYLEELRGLSEGSGVPLKELWRLHAIPDRTYACSNLAVWGRATAEGRLIHARNLDWNIKAGIQDTAAVFVVRPKGKRPYVSAGWAGFVGVLTAVNDRGISIGQVGAETTDVSYRGLPMAFLIRQVMEEAGSLEEAVELVAKARRTVGVNYVIAEAPASRAVAMETTRSLVKVFRADDPAEHGVAYARPIQDAVFRADAAMDASIRDRQLASKGDPRKPGLEMPSGSAYEVRYLGQADGVRRHYGAITPETARQIAKAVAPESNIQSVVFAWPKMWVANAAGKTRATQATYHELNAQRLLEVSDTSQSGDSVRHFP